MCREDFGCIRKLQELLVEAGIEHRGEVLRCVIAG